jgi:hypothetical protein
MIGLDVIGSTNMEAAVTSSAAVFSPSLDGGWYQVAVWGGDVYVKIFAPGAAQAQFTKHAPLFDGNMETYYVPDGGFLGFRCRGGEPAATVEYIKVWNP